MPTINSLINSGTASNAYSSTSSSSSTLDSLKNELSSVSSDTSLDDDEKQEKLSEINSKISSLSSSSKSSSSADLSSMIGGFNSDLMNGMLGNGDGFGTEEINNFFFNTNSTLSALAINYKSSVSIQNQARSLASEIALDKARGVDTSEKQEKLTNLTENVSILNKSLENDISSALSDETTSTADISVIDEIKKSLEQYAKEAKKEVAEKYGTEETTEV